MKVESLIKNCVSFIFQPFKIFIIQQDKELIWFFYSLNCIKLLSE